MEAPRPQVPILNFIRQKYVPASAETATLRLSTMEIAERIAEHVGPNMVSVGSLHEWLVENGYTYDTFGNMQFEWLLKEAE